MTCCLPFFTALSVLLVIFQRHLAAFLFIFHLFLSFIRSVVRLARTLFIRASIAAEIFCQCQMQHLIREWTIDTKIIKHNLLQPTANTPEFFTSSFPRCCGFFFCLLSQTFCMNPNRFVRNIRIHCFFFTSKNDLVGEPV